MSGLSKDHLIFDPAGSDLSECDNVGAFLRSSDGTLLTHTTQGACEALDVNICSPIPLDVDLDGVYDGVTNLDPDNVGAIFHVRNAAPGDAQQSFRSTGDNPDSDAVDPSLVFANDVNSFNMAWNGTGWDRMQVDPDNGSLLVSDCAEAISTAAVSIPDTVGGTQLVASALAGRREITLQNLGAQSVYIGNTGVTTATGIRIGKGASATFKWCDGVDAYAITASGTADIRVMQAA